MQPDAIFVVSANRYKGVSMGHLQGLAEYLDEFYEISVFDKAAESKKQWVFHLHRDCIESAIIKRNITYDLTLETQAQGDKELPKTHVKLLYHTDTADLVAALIKTDKKVKALNLEPITSLKHRHFVKNKTLFVLMKDKGVIFFTLLEGEVVRGIITGFSRYDITINLKGGIPVTVMRHSIFDVRDKKGRCFLKSFQEEHKDWQKSELYIM
jgi:hypothetical protein